MTKKEIIDNKLEEKEIFSKIIRLEEETQIFSSRINKFEEKTQEISSEI